MQVCDCTVEDNLKELIGTTYTNKIHLLFGISSPKNFTVKHAWLGIVMRWVTFWEVSQKM